MKTNRILRVRVYQSLHGESLLFTRFNSVSKNMRARCYRRKPFSVGRLHQLLIDLDRSYKGRYRNLFDGYSYLTWIGRTQNAS